MAAVPGDSPESKIMEAVRKCRGGWHRATTFKMKHADVQKQGIVCSKTKLKKLIADLESGHAAGTEAGESTGDGSVCAASSAGPDRDAVLTFQSPRQTALALQQAGTFKDAGAAAFKAADYALAVDEWTSGVEALRCCPAEAEVESLRLALFNNRAFAHAKLGRDLRAVEADVAEVLLRDPSNVKAIFRRAQARASLLDWEGAVKDLTRVLELQPGNKLAARDLEAARDALAGQAAHPNSAAPEGSNSKETAATAPDNDTAKARAAHVEKVKAEILGKIDDHEASEQYWSDEVAGSNGRSSPSSPAKKLEIVEVDQTSSSGEDNDDEQVRFQAVSPKSSLVRKLAETDVIQDKLLKGLKISPEERSQLGKRRVYQLELDALETSALASEMTVEEEVTERQRRHEAKLAKQGIKVGSARQMAQDRVQDVDSQSEATGMTLEEEVMQRQREHAAKLAKQKEETDKMLAEGQKKKDDTNAEHRKQAQQRISLEKLMNSKEDFVASDTFRGAKPGYIYKLEKDVGLGYHKDGVIMDRLRRKNDAITKNKQAAQQKVENAKEKVAALPAPKAGETWDLCGYQLCDTDVTEVMDRADSAGVTALDLRKNAITDKGLQMICSALAIDKAKLLLDIRLSGGTLTGAVSARLMPVIKMRRPDLVFNIDVPEYVHATHSILLSVQTRVEQLESEEEEATAAPPQVQEPPAKVSLGRTSSGVRPGPSVVFDSDGGCACWLLPLGNAANPPPPTGWLQKNLPPHLTVLQQASTATNSRSVRQYLLSAQPDRSVPIVVEEREALSEGTGSLLGDSAWAAALALAVWLALNPEKVQGCRVIELGAGVGLPALAASLAVSSSGGQAAATEVLMTDMYTELLQLMERNLSLNGLSDDERCSVGHLDWGECSTDDAGQYDLVLGSDVVYPKEGLPASLAAAALGSLRRDAKARLYIMQHGSYMQGVAGAVQDKEGRSFHTRDGWKEFCDMLSEEGIVTTESFALHCCGSKDGSEIEGPNYYASGKESKVEFALLCFRWRPEDCAAWAELGMVEPAEALAAAKQRQQQQQAEETASGTAGKDNAGAAEVVVEVKVEDRESLGTQETVTVTVDPHAPLLEMQRMLASKLDIPVNRQLLRGFIGNGGVQRQPGRYWDLDAARSAAEYKIDSGECEVHLRCMPAAPAGGDGREAKRKARKKAAKARKKEQAVAANCVGDSHQADSDDEDDTASMKSTEEHVAAWIQQEKAAEMAKMEAAKEQANRQAWLEQQKKEKAQQQQEKEAAVAAREAKKLKDAEFFEQQRELAAATLAAAAAAVEVPTEKPACPSANHTVTVEDGMVVAEIDLPGVASMADIVLDMTASSIVISATAQGGVEASVEIALPATVNIDGVRAKFSKKRKKLTVRSPVA